MPRKLSKGMRRANFVYQCIMAVVAGVNFILSTLTQVPIEYYQIFSVVTAAFPVIWTNILDASKKYYDESTPQPASPADTPQHSLDRHLGSSSHSPVPCGIASPTGTSGLSNSDVVSTT